MLQDKNKKNQKDRTREEVLIIKQSKSIKMVKYWATTYITTITNILAMKTII
jgi:hypothetical protein